MKSGAFLVLVLGMLCLHKVHAAFGELDETVHGGKGLKEHGVAAKDREGSGYGGHKGGVNSKGYDRGFSYGHSHDTGKSVSVGDEQYGGKGFGDKEFGGYGLGGIGYGGLGIGAFRAPFLYFR